MYRMAETLSVASCAITLYETERQKRTYSSEQVIDPFPKLGSNWNPSNEAVDLWQPYIIAFQTSAWIMWIDTPSDCAAVSTVQVCVCVCVCVFYNVFNSWLDIHKTVHRDTTMKITNKMHYID